MPVQIYPAGVWEVRANLDQHRTKIFIHHIKVILVAVHMAAMQPWVLLVGLRIGAPSHAKRAAFLRRLANVICPFGVIVAGQRLPLCLIIFSLSLLEAHQIDAVSKEERADVINNLLANVLHEYLGRHGLAAVVFEKMTDTAAGLQQGLIYVQVESVNTFDFKHDFIAQ